MKMTFKASMMKEWTLTDEAIYVGKNEIPLSAITKATHSPSEGMKNGVIQVFHDKNLMGFSTLAYPPKMKADGEKAAEYILVYVGGEKTKAEIEKKREIQEKGFRKKCAVCGKIICYTLEDLKENERLAKQSVTDNVVAIFGTLSGNYAASAVHQQTGNDNLNRIIDYSKCPNCGSRDLVDITDEELAGINTQQNKQSTVSSADELKKFKELLDMGIITQEEFDAKKKQLLGL